MTRLLTLSIVLITAPLHIAAADEVADANSPDRPRIGLVLGGGGARGAAHIGVLKELERLRVPVDAIAGTSMGAIVGGLYATGKSAAEIEDIVNSMDWAAALSDVPQRRDLSFRRKQDDREYPVNFELGLKGTELQLPKGAIQGQKLDLLLRELTLGASHIEDFDELPIPFRAVAADIVAGEQVVLDEGDLAQAIRASMSVPAVFDPVRVDDKMLVDGGIIGNLPVDVVREMGVDIVIAVDVEFPLYPAVELDSVLTISEQMLTILIRRETTRQIDSLSADDVLIRPDLGLFASANFDEVVDTIEPGVEATRGQAARLAHLALAEDAWRQHLASRGTATTGADKLAFVRVEHDGGLAPRILESKLDVEAGDDIDPGVLARNANFLYGLSVYEKTGYRLVEEDGETGAVYSVTPKSWGPNFLQFGISLEDDFDGATSFNLAARLTRAGVNRLGAEWRTDAQLGTDPVLIAEFYQPLGSNSQWFLAPRAEIRQSNFNAFFDGAQVGRYRITDGGVAIDVGRELGRIGEFRIGAFRGGGNSRLKLGDPALPNTDFESGGTFARLRIDSEDNARFPRKGMLADFRWTQSLPGFGADQRYDTIEAEVAQTWSRGKSSLQVGLGYATTLDAAGAVQDFFPLGGFLRLSGLERGALAGPHAGLARLIYYRRMGDSAGGMLDTPFYIGASAEAGNVWQNRSDMSFRSMQLAGSLFAGIDTYFGPLFFAAGFAENGQSNFYLFIGAPPR